ncbi:hypothetical protein [Burkholderia multivorans]|uniref:hypothetical protein n=1 Tax=Burkholderia multivorans TaxID=87883 RepID=UPI00158D08A0|nr:hypothetical protein [Burkholderia multivorans]MBR8044644.1 hypothetical protein [Burkholderia multivorans]MBU9161526.1 hypothetical protein [Burkholderia multivorans]MBU9487816.1 hypothetical protein [Burkholderia multivorans]
MSGFGFDADRIEELDARTVDAAEASSNATMAQLSCAAGTNGDARSAGVGRRKRRDATDVMARAKVPRSGMAVRHQRNGQFDKNLALVGITFLITIAILKFQTGDFKNASHVIRHAVSMLSRNETGTGKGDNIVDSARLRVAHHAGSFAFPAS